MVVEAWRAALYGPPSSFELDREIYAITGSWRVLLEELTAQSWHDAVLFGLLHEEDADALDDRLQDDGDDLTLLDLRPVAERLVEQATGRRWWVAQRLYASLAADWPDIDGSLALRGVDVAGLLEVPARLCNAVHAWLVDGADRKARDRFEAQLARPPRGLDLASSPLWSAEEEGAAFMAAYTAHGAAAADSV